MSSSFLLGVLVGGLITYVGLYISKKWTTKVKTENNQNKRNEGILLFNDYPKFMNTLKQDLSDPMSQSIREFFVVEPEALISSATARFRYDLSEEILSVLKKLEELNYIQRLPNDALLYKIHEDLIKLTKSFESNSLMSSTNHL